MKIKLTIAAMAMGMILIACGKGDSNKEVIETVSPVTKIVKHMGFHFVFDLQSRDKHMQMMKLMKANMEHKQDSTHFISLTIIDTKTSKQITDAKVDLTVSGPAGKGSGGPGALMTGKGMAHYIAEFAKAEPGKYTVAMKTTIKGVLHEHRVDFDLK